MISICVRVRKMAYTISIDEQMYMSAYRTMQNKRQRIEEQGKRGKRIKTEKNAYTFINGSA